MTTCADSTTLRTHLDHPEPALEEHLDACEACSGLLRSVAEDAGITRRALSLLEPGTDTELDVDAAFAAVRSRIDPPVSSIEPSRRHRRLPTLGRRFALAGAAAATVLVVALTPAGRTAVAEALDAFRGERLQVVAMDTGAWMTSLEAIDSGALERLGEVDMSGLAEPTAVTTAGAAEAMAGIAAPVLAEAPGRFLAMAPGTARLVLASRDDNGVPAELDGAVLVVEVPGAILAAYGPVDGSPQLLVGRSGPLVVRAEGAPLEAIRSFLLAYEDLPAELRSQLATIDDWRSTIPLPVPVDGPGWEEVEVAGRPGIAFGDDSGLGAIVLRQDPGGMVTVVGGQLTVSAALELAAGA
jgi:hypothetical protein